VVFRGRHQWCRAAYSTDILESRPGPFSTREASVSNSVGWLQTVVQLGGKSHSFPEAALTLSAIPASCVSFGLQAHDFSSTHCVLPDPDICHGDPKCLHKASEKTGNCPKVSYPYDRTHHRQERA